MRRKHQMPVGQTPSPPQRLPRLLLQPAANGSISLRRRHQSVNEHDITHFSPPHSPDTSAPTILSTHHPKEDLSKSSQLRSLKLVSQHNTYTGASTDTRRARINNLPSVSSGVIINDFYEGTWPSTEEDEKNKQFQLKEQRRYRKEIDDAKNFCDSDNGRNFEVTPQRSLVPASLPNPDASKSNNVGRFVVLKANVANATDSAVPIDVRVQNDKNRMSGLPENHYWTVSGGKGVLLTAPGAQRLDDIRSTSTGSNRSIHTRFRQVFVENMRPSRLRANSEQQQNHQQGGSRSSSRTAFLLSDSLNKSKTQTVKFNSLLPPHAHTITAGTGSTVARALLHSTQQAKENELMGADGMSLGTSGMSSSPMQERYHPSISLSSVNDSDGTGYPSGSKKRLKSTRKMVRKFLKLSSSQKKQGDDSGELPDPSKLPREIRQSSLEFTQSRLKNAPRKSVPPNAYGQKGQTIPPWDVIPRLLPQDEAKSEELLLNMFSRSLSGSSGHGSSIHSHGHHHNHHSYHRGHHSHDRRNLNPMALTRVTENRRYLMFTKASPFRSPHDFLQTRGIGLSESEVYTVLFRHTTCYELMPESAKLVILDSMLTVGLAFRALCVNGIRAAPVWYSDRQAFAGVLTLNDFLEMLTYAWRREISNSHGDGETTAVEDLESTPIKKWIEIRDLKRKRDASVGGHHDTIHEEDEDKVEDARSRRSSVSNGTDGGNDDDDGDSNSVASAPSQLGDSEHIRKHLHSHSHHGHHGLRMRSMRRTDEKCSARMKYHRLGGLTIVYPEDSLYTALRLLAHHKLHRLPVFDDPLNSTGNPLFVLTHRSLLAYLYRKQIDLPRPKYLQTPLKEARVGTYSNLALVLPSTKLVDALTFFEDERVSALPVVDSFTDRRLLDIFAKFDVITLILAGKHTNPDKTVQEVLDICKQIHHDVIPTLEGQNKFDVEICRTTDTIQFALNKLMRTGYHRLIIVDDPVNCRVEGVVSISDLLYYMILRPSPRGPIASLQARATTKQSKMNTVVPDTTAASPDWLFYSEHDPKAMRYKPCIPLVRDSPEATSKNNGKETTVSQKQRRHRSRLISGNSVATASSSCSSSVPSSAFSSSTTSSTDYSSSSSDDEGPSKSPSSSANAASVATKTRSTTVRDTRRQSAGWRGRSPE